MYTVAYIWRLPACGSRTPRTPPGPGDPDFAAVPFTSLYLTGDEWAAEIVNRTVHGGHAHRLGSRWAGGYRGQMAVRARYFS